MWWSRSTREMLFRVPDDGPMTNRRRPSPIILRHSVPSTGSRGPLDSPIIPTREET
jgi:hypothetical protein